MSHCSSPLIADDAPRPANPLPPPGVAVLQPGQVLGLMLGACLVWALASWLGSANLDRYHDMLENYAWSQPLLLGTHKHPPFFAWVTGAWFAIFPQADWAYRLLSYTNVAVGLGGVWVLGRRLGVGALAPWGALLLLWSIPYTSLAGKFNANTQLLSLWPWVAALMLVSWQERGLRGLLASVGLGLVAAASMLSKYYSGVFLTGLLAPIFMHRMGRAWLATLRPYVALLVFGAALAPHIWWNAQHDWAALAYAFSQGGGKTSWSYLLRFALAPIFYWLPAWLAGLLLFSRVHAQHKQLPFLPVLGQFAVKSWQRLGQGDTLFWLALMPWLLTLLFGLAGVVELSTPWAIPIGYAFALLWLRNWRVLSPQAVGQVLASLQRFWWWVCAVVLLGGLLTALVAAQKGDSNYYRPSQEAAQTIAADWQQRHPNAPLQWVGGDWAENALLSFYALPGLRTVAGMPDELPAQLAGLHDWQQRPGLLLCPLGRLPLEGTAAALENALAHQPCAQAVRAWLQARQLPEQLQHYTVSRQGWRFPQAQPFGYAVWAVLP